MRLVKAKLKENFDAVLRAQCCPDYSKKTREDTRLNGILTLDLNDWAEDPIYCAYCNTYFGIVKGVVDIATGLLVPLDLFDLDEGEYGTN